MTGFPATLENMENLENLFQVFRHEKVREFEKSDSNRGKIGEFYYVHLPKRERGCAISLFFFS